MIGICSKVSAGGATDTGLRRTSNEDSFLVHQEAGCFLVADGMGGAAAGEIASGIFTDTAKRVVPACENRAEEEAVSLVKDVFLSANTAIRKHITAYPEHAGMGCTAEILLFHDRGFVLGHIGDSRTYRLRNGQLQRLTKDHTFIQDQIDQGVISRDQARSHKLRNVISRAVGVEDHVEVDIIRGRFRDGDIFLLCSDGLTDMVGDPKLQTSLCAALPLQKKVVQLVEQANSAGGRDNISVVLVEVNP